MVPLSLSFALIFGLFGVVIGSFLNVLILRRGIKSILGRSGCLSCAHELEAVDLVPVLSWLALRGRCRFCGSRISVQYPLVEASTALLFALIGAAFWPQLVAMPLMGALLLADYLAIAALLVCISAYDIKHTIIPDQWAYSFALLAFLSQFLDGVFGAGTWWVLLLSGPAAALPFAALWFVSGGRWMGLGDAKLALGIGWLLGPIYALLAIVFSFVIGALISVCILLPLPRILRALAKLGITSFRISSAGFTMKSEVAFGPFLVLGCIIVWLLLLYGIDPLALFGAGSL
jgi:leader peptidase (prepilin peptidase)/N-methyltransferase